MFSNKFVRNFVPYKLSSHKAWELDDNTNCLKLDWNEATIPPTPKVSEYINNFLLNGKLNWYPDVCNSELISKLANYSGVSESCVQYFGSSDYLHEYLVRTFLEDGDRVVMVSPTYDNFRSAAESLGAIVDYFFLDHNFSLDIDKLCSYIDVHNPKLIYICNPNNPTGNLTSSKEVEYLVGRYKKVLFVIDEAYYEFSGESSSGLVNDYNNIFITRTFSKAFALASFRIGYAISCEQNITAISKIRNAKNIAQLSQIAAIAALDDVEYMKAYVKEVSLAKKFFSEKVLALKSPSIEIVVGDGNFVLLRIDQSRIGDFLKYFESHKVFVRSYSHVPTMSDFVRITCGTVEQMDFVFKILSQFIGDYK